MLIMKAVHNTKYKDFKKTLVDLTSYMLQTHFDETIWSLNSFS